MTEDEVDALIGGNVQRLRQAAGLSQTELATRLEQELGRGFQQQTVLKIEKGTRPIKMTEAAALARVLRCDVETLLKRSSDEEDRLMVELLTVQQEQAHATNAVQRLRSQVDAAMADLAEAQARVETLSARWRQLSEDIREQRARDAADREAGRRG